jgi:methylphosphotriester-DNA--protein-cysteine methyltransferase
MYREEARRERSGKFREISGMQFREYLRLRRLAFTLADVRSGERSILDIALDYGFSSHTITFTVFRESFSLNNRFQASL